MKRTLQLYLYSYVCDSKSRDSSDRTEAGPTYRPVFQASPFTFHVQEGVSPPHADCTKNSRLTDND